MCIVILAGSKGGASRTTTSMLLAAGLHEIGLRPVLMQFAASGLSRSLAATAEVPFEILYASGDTPDLRRSQIFSVMASKAQASHVIVDMPAQSMIDTLVTVAGLNAQILLPMREGAAEIECAIYDHRMARDYQDDKIAQRSPMIWFLPVGWPRSLKKQDFVAILRRRGAMLENEENPPIIARGIPRIDPLDIDFTSPLSDSSLSSTLQEAALDAIESVMTELLIRMPNLETCYSTPFRPVRED